MPASSGYWAFVMHEQQRLRNALGSVGKLLVGWDGSDKPLTKGPLLRVLHHTHCSCVCVCVSPCVMTVQIEQHAEVRAAFPTPQQGGLPLPEGLPSAMLECNPQAVEDLNAVVPQAAQPLSSQALNEQVSVQATTP